MKILFAILLVHFVLGLLLPFRGYDKIAVADQSIGIAELRAMVIQDIVFIFPSTAFAVVILLVSLNKKIRLKRKQEIFNITTSSILLFLNVLLMLVKEFRGIDDFLKFNNQHLYLEYKYDANKAVILGELHKKKD